MRNNFFEGIKFGLGILFIFGLVGLVYAAGWHVAGEILPGQFADGNYSFNGSLGIGTSNPFREFHVNSNTNDRVARFESIDNQTSIELIDNNLKYSVIEQNSLGLSLSADSGISDHLIIETNGNVGIGTTSPGAKLDVNGDIRADTYRNLNNSFIQITAKAIVPNHGYTGSLNEYADCPAGYELIFWGSRDNTIYELQSGYTRHWYSRCYNSNGQLNAYLYVSNGYSGHGHGCLGLCARQ